MNDDETIHFRKRTGKTYVSPSIRVDGPTERRIRIASKVIDGAEGHHHAIERGELVLRVTQGGRQEIIAKFYEDDRGIFVLTFQRYRKDTGAPYERTYFSFTGHEINRLLEFILNLKRLHLPSDEKINVTDDELRRVILSNDQVRRLVLDNQDLITKIATNEITRNDIVALGYRREQLKRYERLITDPDFFAAVAAESSATPEKVWQSFFEANKWIFGYGLNYVFLSGLDGKKLEQIVAGYSLKDGGKRADAVLKTRGLISSLCFVEIKHHMTALLKNTPYRPRVWQPSDELSGGVSQSQVTVHAAVKQLGERLDVTDTTGTPTGEVLYGIKPRSFVVVGNLKEFETDHGVNEPKYRSFELYRRNISEPEIITFDELYHRAKFIVEHHD